VQSGFPRKLDRFDQPPVGAPTAIGDVERRHDPQLGRMRPCGLHFDIEIEVEKILVAAP
jgi:hypothetical protein